LDTKEQQTPREERSSVGDERDVGEREKESTMYSMKKLRMKREGKE
jgi:hypothetical protein